MGCLRVTPRPRYTGTLAGNCTEMGMWPRRTYDQLPAGMLAWGASRYHPWLFHRENTSTCADGIGGTVYPGVVGGVIREEAESDAVCSPDQ